MKNIFSFLICLILIFSLSACNDSDNVVLNQVPGNEAETQPVEESTIIPNRVEEGSEAYLAVRKVAGEFIDKFISCDFDAIKEALHKDDEWLFNFESEDQMRFYKTIFPKVEYSLSYVDEHEGVYGVMANMTSPNMADVYGTLITERIDNNVLNNKDSLQNIVTNDTDRLIELISDPEVPRRDEMLYIYVQYIDGEYIPRCDVYLANELTGGAPEASEAISMSLSEAISALSEE